MSDPFFFLKFQFLHCWINGKTPTKHTRGSFFRFFFFTWFVTLLFFCRLQAWSMGRSGSELSWISPCARSGQWRSVDDPDWSDCMSDDDSETQKAVEMFEIWRFKLDSWAESLWFFALQWWTPDLVSKVDVTGSCFFSRDWLFTFFTICMLIGDLVKSYLLVICICFLNPDVSVIHRVSLYKYKDILVVQRLCCGHRSVPFCSEHFFQFWFFRLSRITTFSPVVRIAFFFNGFSAKCCRFLTLQELLINLSSSCHPRGQVGWKFCRSVFCWPSLNLLVSWARKGLESACWDKRDGKDERLDVASPYHPYHWIFICFGRSFDQILSRIIQLMLSFGGSLFLWRGGCFPCWVSMEWYCCQCGCRKQIFRQMMDLQVHEGRTLQSGLCEGDWWRHVWWMFIM